MDDRAHRQHSPDRQKRHRGWKRYREKVALSGTNWHVLELFSVPFRLALGGHRKNTNRQAAAFYVDCTYGHLTVFRSAIRRVVGARTFVGQNPGRCENAKRSARLVGQQRHKDYRYQPLRSDRNAVFIVDTLSR